MSAERKKGNEGESGAEPVDMATGRPAAGSPDSRRPGGDVVDGETTVESDLNDLIEQARSERDEYLNLAQRTKADFDNYRRRVAAEAAEAAVKGKLEVVSGLIEAIDNLERVMQNEGVALDAALDGGFPDGAPVSLQGVIVAYRDLHSTLRRADVEAYDPAGQPFDPNLHEALQAVPSDGVEPGIVVDVAQRGYRAEERVIRPARVVVSQ